MSAPRKPIARTTTPATRVRRGATPRKALSVRRIGASPTLDSYIKKVELALERHLTDEGLLLELGVDMGLDQLVEARLSQHGDWISFEERCRAQERVNASLPEELRALQLRLTRYEDAAAGVRADVAYRVGLEVGRLIARGVL